MYTNLIIDHEYVYESGHTTPHTNTDRNSRLFFLSFFLWWFTPNLILNPIPKKGVFSRDPEGIAQNIIIYLSIYLLTYIYRTILAVIICIIKGYLPKIHCIHTHIHHIYNYRRIISIFGTKLSYKTKFTTVHLLISIYLFLLLHLSLVTIFINTTT